MRIIDYRDYFNMGSDEFQPGDVIRADVVMVIGHGEDYAIYVAPRTGYTADEIAREGDKVLDQAKVANGMFSTAAYGRRARG